MRDCIYRNCSIVLTRGQLTITYGLNLCDSYVNLHAATAVHAKQENILDTGNRIVSLSEWELFSFSHPLNHTVAPVFVS